MLDQIKIAFESQDYSTAENLLKQLLQQSPENPWGQLYLGRLKEVSLEQEQAEIIYRNLLKSTTNSKIISQARQGLRRLEDIKQEEKQKAIAQLTSDPQYNSVGILVLEPINNELKSDVARHFAKIMQIDSYTARLTLPSRSFRVYRVGKIGELAFYGQQLQAAGIPCFWLKLDKIREIQVFQVRHLSVVKPGQICVFCTNQHHQLGSLNVNLSEITTKVMGLLPIFEEVIDINMRGKLEWRTKTQDYAQFCDLHLPKKSSILRMYDYGYEYQKSSHITPEANQNTIKINWNNLMSWVNQTLPNLSCWNDFTPFAETAVDQTEMLNQIPSHVELYRKEKSNWDTIFNLYSGMVFCKKSQCLS